jgi:hypothetical protein
MRPKRGVTVLQQLKHAADSSILETYPHYRTAIGVLGVTLPPILILASVLASDRGAESSIGWTMVVMLILAIANQFAPAAIREALAPWRPLLAIETVLIVLFGVSWFTKGRELAAAQ